MGSEGVQAIRIQLFDANVVLVATPGFDDAQKSDVTVLEIIGEWLKKMYVTRDTVQANLN